MQDIECLIESSVDVVINRSRQIQCFIGDRHFELPELKLLIDAVQASKLLSAKRMRNSKGRKVHGVPLTPITIFGVTLWYGQS